jgi:hypothetical protein
MVNQMKILAIQMAYFRLPDDFSGGVSDALRCLADFHDKAQVQYAPQPFKDLDMTISEVCGSIFDQFISAVQTEKRFVGLVQLGAFDPMVDIPALVLDNSKVK